jgi:hypothetical protein
LNEPSDDFEILINITAHCNRRPIKHYCGCSLGGPRIVDVNGYVELAQRRPLPALKRLPPCSSNLTFREDCDDNWLAVWQWNYQSAAKTAQNP